MSNLPSFAYMLNAERRVLSLNHKGVQPLLIAGNSLNTVLEQLNEFRKSVLRTNFSGAATSKPCLQWRSLVVHKPVYLLQT